jgi:voltage-gated potassium channel
MQKKSTLILRKLRAQWRDGRVLFRESRFSILLFFATIILGAAILKLFYTDPLSGRPLAISEAVYTTFAMVFFEMTIPYPDHWYLQALFFIIPILGLAAIANGVIRFWTALTNKEERGEKWQVAMASTYKNHVIVCGFGKVGFRVTEELLRFGRDVIAIESNPQGRFVEKARDMDVTLLIADARRSNTLMDANVDKADAIIPCTDDELTNLDIALDAREINPDIKVVMRMFDPDLARRVEKGFGIHTAFSTSALTAPVFAAAAMRADVKYSFYVEDTLLNISEVIITPDSELLGWTLGKLTSELNISVVYYQKKGVAELHPDPDFLLESGTKILALGSIETLKQLSRLNRSKP